MAHITKGVILYPYHELFSNIKKWNIDFCYSVYEPQKQYRKWMKPDNRDYWLHDFIYMKCPGKKKQIYRHRK